MPRSPSLRRPTRDAGRVAPPSAGGPRSQSAPGTSAPRTALTSVAAPSPGGPRYPGPLRRRQPGRHLGRPIDPVAASIHGSGRADTGAGGLFEVWELAGTTRAA
ncbi:hypothetical protein NDU88_006147 [Pleurodeles waltl]|uniref:Uncharacterized protein n=1 Tax=Pleurodeles waltl TaxID=8319 RepID=A0AAV7SNN9_PLEWA|nr:hypothetical protein NDU88_006147 [Pleurodeles waltl]